MRLLDLFCGEGGAAHGYARAGFDVVGVDNVPRPAYPYEFVLADATTYPLDGFDVVAASPPCTEHSSLAHVANAARGGSADTGWMLPHTLERLRAWGKRGGVWVVENVEGAKASMPDPVKLCGSMFDLTDGGWLLRRHRYFSSNVLLMPPGPCRCHGRNVIGIYGDLTPNDRRCAGTRANRPNGDLRAGVERARRLMQMPWATPEGLTLAIPPAYTEFIGSQLVDFLAADCQEASA